MPLEQQQQQQKKNEMLLLKRKDEIGGVGVGGACANYNCR